MKRSLVKTTESDDVRWFGGGRLLVGRHQMAVLMGVHVDSVTHYAKDGMPVVTKGGRGAESEYDAVECLAWQRERLGKNAKDAAQTRLYEANANLADIKIAQQRYELFPREQLVREGQAFVRAWQAMLRRLPRRFALAGLIRRDQEPAAAEVVRDVLDEASRWKTQADLKRAVR